MNIYVFLLCIFTCVEQPSTWCMMLKTCNFTVVTIPHLLTFVYIYMERGSWFLLGPWNYIYSSIVLPIMFSQSTYKNFYEKNFHLRFHIFRFRPQKAL